MHILLAESGATKTSWWWADAKGARELVNAPGYNPNVWGFDEIAHSLSETLLPALAHKGIRPKQLYFYGPALNNPAFVADFQALFKSLFPQLENLSVYHDVLAAARACWGNAPGWVGILGTGSNLAYYDGNQVLGTAGGHGYLLGDEGSGFDLGKHFLRLLLEGQLPEPVVTNFEQITGFAPLAYRHHVYQAKYPNREVAALTKILHRHRHLPALNTLITSRFQVWLERYAGPSVQGWPACQSLRVVGSVAHFFEAELQAAAQAMGIKVEGILRAPAQALMAYHLAQLQASNAL